MITLYLTYDLFYLYREGGWGLKRPTVITYYLNSPLPRIGSTSDLCGFDFPQSLAARCRCAEGERQGSCVTTITSNVDINWKE